MARQDPRAGGKGMAGLDRGPWRQSPLTLGEGVPPCTPEPVSIDSAFVEMRNDGMAVATTTP